MVLFFEQNDSRGPPFKPRWGERLQFDYVVIGAGSAGCAIAARLSEDPAVTVALIEAGGRDWNLWIHIPVGYFKIMHNPAIDWCYRTAPDPGLNGRRIEWPRGKVLGGSSALNGLLYLRGQAEDYDHWRQLGNSGWAWDNVLPYFLKSEDQAAVPVDDMHREGGEWRVENQRLSWEILDALPVNRRRRNIIVEGDSGPARGRPGWLDMPPSLLASAKLP